MLPSAPTLRATKYIGSTAKTRRKEFFFAEFGEKAKSLEFVFYGIFELSEAQRQATP